MRAAKIRCGIGVAAFGFDRARDYFAFAEQCEAGGVDSLWQTDRLVGADAQLEPMTAMASLAGATERIKFGMNAVVVAYRDPLVLAKECATIDFLSGGRLLPVFGVGFEGDPTWRAIGRDPAVRGNCSIKRAMNDSARALEVCPAALVTNEDKRRALRAAIDGGDPSQIADLVSNLLAGMHQLAEGELASLLQEGLRIETAGLGPDGDVFSIPKVNPRAEPTLKLLDMLGASAAQQAITPKSQGERKRDEGIDELAALVAGRASSRTARERAVTAGAPPPEPES
jgi:hypothetical protein